MREWLLRSIEKAREAEERTQRKYKEAFQEWEDTRRKLNALITVRDILEKEDPKEKPSEEYTAKEDQGLTYNLPLHEHLHEILRNREALRSEEICFVLKEQGREFSVSQVVGEMLSHAGKLFERTPDGSWSAIAQEKTFNTLPDHIYSILCDKGPLSALEIKRRLGAEGRGVHIKTLNEALRGYKFFHKRKDKWSALARLGNDIITREKQIYNILSEQGPMDLRQIREVLALHGYNIDIARISSVLSKSKCFEVSDGIWSLKSKDPEGDPPRFHERIETILRNRGPLRAKEILKILIQDGISTDRNRVSATLSYYKKFKNKNGRWSAR